MIAVPHHISPKDYLELEHNSPHRHEYRYGLVYAMAGSTDNHARLIFNVLKAIDRRLGDTDCRFYAGEVKVSYQDEFYYYPDAFVTCDPRDKQDRYIKRHPQLIVEVLSKSTRKFDQGDKFTDYKELPSLKEYVLIEQDQQQVECHHRQADDTWTTVTYKTGDRVRFESIDLEIAIAQLYQGLD